MLVIRSRSILSKADVFLDPSGFVMRGYLGGRTLATKSIALPLSVASGLTLGMKRVGRRSRVEADDYFHWFRQGRAVRPYRFL